MRTRPPGDPGVQLGRRRPNGAAARLGMKRSLDSFLVGLTATPKDEVDHNTYDLFDLEDGVPTDAYGLDEAVRDKFLVPPRAVSVQLKFQREAINYTDLSEEEKDRWDSAHPFHPLCSYPLRPSSSLGNEFYCSCSSGK
jgi:hypothetical protein